eukprot:GHVT01009069.1.p1 GENE.GHVT01009069.1~~GHVT01009069.1.p1  ORF type:complete len:616 (+),score=168.85 GHVT01009069.1:50-1849(+)
MATPSGSPASSLKAAGNAKFAAGEYAAAADLFSQAIEAQRAEGGEALAVLLSNRSGAYAALEKLSEALQDAEEAIKIRPGWAKAFGRKGLALFRLGRLSEALAAYDAGLALEPTNAALLEGQQQVQVAAVAEASGKTGGAADGLSGLASGFDADQLVRRQVSQSVMMLVESDATLRGYAKEDPSFLDKVVDVTIQLTKIAAEKPQEAASFLRMLGTSDKRVLRAVMMTMGMKGGDEEFDDSPSSSKPANSSNNQRSDTNHKQTEPVVLTEAEREAERLKTEGNSLYKARQFPEALEKYDEALKLCPNNLLFNNNKAAVYMEQGKFESCVKECQQALERRYECKTDFSVIAKIMNRLAACYLRQGLHSEAIAMYEKSLMEDNNRHTRNALTEAKRLQLKKEKEAYVDPELAEKHREKGNEFFKSGDFPSAKKEYDEAIRRHPTEPKLYSNRAAALTKLLEYPSALKDCEEALRLDPKFVKGWSRKGNLHVMMKELNKAMEAFQKGIDVDPESAECKSGLQNVLMQVNRQRFSTDVDAEQSKKAMADPEIQAILADPNVNIMFKNIQEDNTGETLRKARADPQFAKVLAKLEAAGIVRYSF